MGISPGVMRAIIRSTTTLARGWAASRVRHTTSDCVFPMNSNQLARLTRGCHSRGQLLTTERPYRTNFTDFTGLP